jgi:hypothetical protein
MTASTRMATNPQPLTDPARELADLCAALGEYTDIPGDVHLATNFDVEPWSAEFYQIIGCIVERCDNLIEVVNSLDIDEDYKGEAVAHIAMVKAAFSKSSLMNAWSTRGQGHTLLSASNVQPIKMLSHSVRSKVSYPKLSKDDIASLLDDTAQFQDWLTGHQLAEQDFVRQALLDSVKQFRFRLSKINWVGWGYTYDSLQEVLAAYMILQHSVTDPLSNPDAEAVLKKGASFFVKLFGTIGVSKDVVQKADFLVRAFGAVALIQHGTSAVALLTHLKG